MPPCAFMCDLRMTSEQLPVSVRPQSPYKIKINTFICVCVCVYTYIYTFIFYTSYIYKGVYKNLKVYILYGYTKYKCVHI